MKGSELMSIFYAGSQCSIVVRSQAHRAEIGKLRADLRGPFEKDFDRLEFIDLDQAGGS
jgi:hypothetical protein